MVGSVAGSRQEGEPRSSANLPRTEGVETKFSIGLRRLFCRLHEGPVWTILQRRSWVHSRPDSPPGTHPPPSCGRTRKCLYSNVSITTVPKSGSGSFSCRRPFQSLLSLVLHLSSRGGSDDGRPTASRLRGASSTLSGLCWRRDKYPSVIPSSPGRTGVSTRPVE